MGQGWESSEEILRDLGSNKQEDIIYDEYDLLWKTMQSNPKTGTRFIPELRRASFLAIENYQTLMTPYRPPKGR